MTSSNGQRPLCHKRLQAPQALTRRGPALSIAYPCTEGRSDNWWRQLSSPRWWTSAVVNTQWPGAAPRERLPYVVRERAPSGRCRS